jgi:hypothetical protein
MLRTKMGTQCTINQQTNHEERNQTSKNNVKVPEACNNQLLVLEITPFQRWSLKEHICIDLNFYFITNIF